MKLRRMERDSSIPTSSMADIAFLLIIFFMVTSVFSATRGLDLKLPDEQMPPDPEPEEAVFIHVRTDGIEVDCRPMHAEELLSHLESKLARNPNKPVILYTDSRAEYQRMVEVYDLLGQSRATHVVVPTQSEIADYVATFGENPMENRCTD